MGWFGDRGADDTTVSPAEVHAMLQTNQVPVILDVRSAAEYTGDGHIPGARHVPLDRLMAEFGRLDRDAQYITVCRSGARSARAQQALLRAGFARTRNMRGGMLRWQGPIVHDGP